MKSSTSLDRVLTSLSHKEPDRVPVFLLLTMHGAKELGISIQDYFSSADNVIEGQVRMRKKFGHDCYFPFFYAAIEVEAMGQKVIFRKDGPPNAGQPLIRSFDDIPKFEVPDPKQSPVLQKVLQAIAGIKQETGTDAPIIGVAVSPFSLPVMLMGFERYLDLILEQRDLFWQLQEKVQDFCVQWSNAQLEAGATAICYFDPISSPTVVPPSIYRETGWKIAKQTLAQIKGPTATHLASGRTLEIAHDIVQTGTQLLGASMLDDLAELKKRCQGKLCILGTLNGVAMARWSENQAKKEVTACIDAAAAGGGFILSDNHGEIPWQVPEKVLHSIMDCARDKGRYPIG